jgi:hypothetical protein
MTANANHPTEMRGRHNRWWYRVNQWRITAREWLLEDSASKGLGGPPNGWQSTGPMRGRSTIGDTAEYTARFMNDAFEVGVYVRYTDDQGDEGHWIGTYPTWLFRRIAWWYLWRWAYGEWFGLRRTLYYRWLHRHVARYRIPRSEKS